MALISTNNSRYVFVAITVGCLLLMMLRQSLAPLSVEQKSFGFLMKRKPVCSMDVIRKYCLEHNYFPTGGQWLNSTYFPDLCRFPSNGITKEQLRGCLSRKNVTKIVVIGDSNGMRYFGATRKQLQKFMKCKSVKGERGSTMPDVSYFTKGTKLKASDIVAHQRDCNGCTSVTMSCRDGTTEIILEYIVMEFYLDTEVTTVRNNWKKNCHNSKHAPLCRQSNTYQEFIFGEYLASNKYPDVILLFSGNHDKARAGRLGKNRSNMEYLKMLIKTYVAKKTKVFWFSKISENRKQKTEYWKNVRFEDKWKTNEFIERLNLQLFDVLRTEFNETGGNILPFFDVYDMSLGVMDWTLDGMHRRGRWYEVVISHWIQTFCET